MKYGIGLLLCLFLSAGTTMAAELPGDSVYRLPATFSDQDGVTREWSALQGSARLVSMFYSHCPMACPLIIEHGKQIQRRLGESLPEATEFVLISMDPERDTPAVLTDTAQKHQLDMRRWSLLAPRAADVRALAGILDIRYRKLKDGSFNHTSVWVLLDAEGRVLARTEVSNLTPDPQFVEQVRRTLAL
ncbi:MAG: SCO family protein [Xanthomonadaceae bacterium]|jgi:protein SCO1/2|nr:SCO family protein [Xanthomonadaceae bacterium]